MRHVLALVLALTACGGTKPPVATPAVSKPAEASCAADEMMHEDVCLKTCAKETDCKAGQQCEQLHVMNEDGTIGPVSGNACTGP